VLRAISSSRAVRFAPQFGLEGHGWLNYFRTDHASSAMVSAASVIELSSRQRRPEGVSFTVARGSLSLSLYTQRSRDTSQPSIGYTARDLQAISYYHTAARLLIVNLTRAVCDAPCACGPITWRCRIDDVNPGRSCRVRSQSSPSSRSSNAHTGPLSTGQPPGIRDVERTAYLAGAALRHIEEESGIAPTAAVALGEICARYYWQLAPPDRQHQRCSCEAAR
jgi:hypothetical protein